jgi:hypothetical protein
MIVLVALPSIGLAPINAFPIAVREPFNSLLGPDITSNVTYYRGVNIWIGPSATNLIRFGAKFTPCMRTDFGIQRRNGLLYINPVTESLIICCQNRANRGNVEFRMCGASLENATNELITFLPEPCTSNMTNFHPCCVSITGLCRVMDVDQCRARGGFFHPDETTCDQVGVVIENLQ